MRMFCNFSAWMMPLADADAEKWDNASKGAVLRLAPCCGITLAVALVVAGVAIGVWTILKNRNRPH